MTMTTYFKIAKPDGWDFYTGETINYRDCLVRGVPAQPPTPDRALGLCSSGVIHASRRAEDCFQGGTIPCSLFRVRGKPVVKDASKAGFLSLEVVEELNPANHFRWRYEKAVNPVRPFSLTPPPIDNEILALLTQWASVGYSVWASVGASVRASVWASGWDSVRASVGASAWDSVRASVGASMGYSVRASVRESVGAYVGYIFAPVVPAWRTMYPYQAGVDLWKCGLVPSFDGRVWRLHGHEDARVLWEGTV